MFQNSAGLARRKQALPLLFQMRSVGSLKLDLRWIKAHRRASAEDCSQSNPTGISVDAFSSCRLHASPDRPALVIAALVIFQLVFGEDIVPAFRAYRQGTEPQADALLNANIHVYVGLAVLVLAILRVALRIRYGAPDLPADESIVLQYIAKLAHIVLYAAIFLMPLTGALAWYLGMGEIGELHEIGKPVLIVVVALHAVGALWQHFVVKTDVLRRMLKPMA